MGVNGVDGALSERVSLSRTSVSDPWEVTMLYPGRAWDGQSLLLALVPCPETAYLWTLPTETG